MPNEQRTLKAFLCHAHSDRDAVRHLYYRLISDGIDAWLDKEKLLPGQNWELEIRRAVREADVVVVCLSRQFNQAGFRQKEVRLAIDTAMEKPQGEIFIIPARLEECDNLESLRHLHWVDLFEDVGYKRLRQSLDLRSEQVGAIASGEFKSKSLVRISEDPQFAKQGVTASVGDQNNIGVALIERGHYPEAIKYLERALMQSKRTHDRKSEATVLNNLGSTYERIGDLVQAIKFYEQAILIDVEPGT